ncbi:MAG: VWA domain-containing protein [Candidatus Kapaibacterium sp.]|jgi:hypothetical protein
MSSERGFFKAMEEFGFFSHIYEHLPADVTAVFEIARVLEDEDSILHKQLLPALKLPTLGQSSQRDFIDDFQREVPSGDEYEADLMQSHRDIARIYPSQFLLPDRLFYQKLAERTLWMPVAKAPKILPIEDVSNSFGYDSRKQKVFVLFDTSSSMSTHHRIELAKAILYHFLKRNMKEMGFVSVRTFDDHVGDVHTAIDQPSFDALLRYTLRLSHLGDGTVLQRALIQTLKDIHEQEYLSGAEILIITDGAVVLQEELIREHMDDQIKIHTVKIGHVQIFPSDAFIDDHLRASKNFHDVPLEDLQHQEEAIVRALKQSEATAKHKQLAGTLATVRQQITARKRILGERLGHELERLSTVYINVDDFNETNIFRADAETIVDLEQLSLTLEHESEEFQTTDVTKKLAILHDHINFLLKYETDVELRSRLLAINERLLKLLNSYLSDGKSSKSTSKGEPSGALSVPMTEEDLRDLRFLLEMGGDKTGSSWDIVFKWLWRQAVRRVSTWQQHRKIKKIH